ncbi:STAS domain-containing protein [Sphingomonas sp. 37zxx]|uniref:STAS domain-containing protein n=1 Tax=Sphingomonas sp. 37zxx TaxID=1550073 RepID=UPI00053BFC07|nr:STAS domain-containing protein [Sphingomonas sp. 37zxx]
MTLTLSPPDPDAEPGVICLSGHGTTVTAVDLQAQLIAAADTVDGTAIDASSLLSVGQAVLQLLIAARQEAIEQDQDFRFVGVSDAFSERVSGCQLAEAIGLEAGKELSQ